MSNESRAAFEAWCKVERPSAKLDRDGDTYGWSPALLYWEVWQASRKVALAAEPIKPAECKEGCPPLQICDCCQGTGGKDNASDVLFCDDCGVETPDPWHSSTETNKHHHRCDKCHLIAMRASDALEIKNIVLQNDLNTALGMLADWCVAIDENGGGWDAWDDCFKQAMYRDGPLRSMIDKEIEASRKRNIYT